MRRPKSIFLAILVVFLTPDFSIAANENQVDDNIQGDDGNNGDDNAQADQGNYYNAQGQGGGYANGYYQNFQTQKPTSSGTGEATQTDGYYRSQNMVCSDSVIQVQNIVTYCDSPGTFYYGSGKYRDSQTCQPGDKARVLINFYIANHDIIQQAGNYALVDVYADGGYYTDSVTIYDAADLCSLSSLKIKGRNQCPYNGYYQIKTHFYWGKSGQDETFEPVIHVGFKSNIKKNVYDYGGANTNLCRGSTFLTWSDGVRVSYANAVGNFMKSFGILLLTILFLGILAWFLSNRPRSFKEAKAKLLAFHRFPRTFRGQTHRDLSMHPDEEFDFRKIQTAGNRDLVDF